MSGVRRGALRTIWLVARREIVARGRSKAYRLSTVALIAVFVVGAAASQVVPGLFEDDPTRLGLVGEVAALEGALTDAADRLGRDVTLEKYADREAAEVALVQGDLDAALVAPDALLFETEADAAIEALVARAAYQEALPQRAADLGLSIEEARSLTTPPPIESSLLDPAEDEPDEAERDSGLIVGSFATVLLLMAITFYGNWVLVGVIEEKANRVAEVLLSTVAPWQLLVGKVLGILALGAGQMGAGLVALLVVLLAMGVELPPLALTAVGMAALWLVLGLLTYNFIYAAAGATVNRSEEATSASTPIMIPVMAAYFASIFYVPQAPDGLASRILSLFPLSSPLAMPARIGAGGGSIVEVVLAVLLSLLGIALVIWFAARVYSGGLLQSRRIGFLAAFRSREV